MKSRVQPTRYWSAGRFWPGTVAAGRAGPGVVAEPDRAGEVAGVLAG